MKTTVEMRTTSTKMESGIIWHDWYIRPRSVFTRLLCGNVLDYTAVSREKERCLQETSF